LSSVSASGPLTELKGSLKAEVEGLRFAGRDLGGAHADLAFEERRGVVVRALHVGDVAGRLDVSGSVGLGAAHALDLRVALGDAQLALIPAADLRLKGTAHADLAVGGSLERPVAAGRLGVTGLAFLDTILGSADLALEAQGGRVHFHGRLFQGKLTVDGTVAFHGLAMPDLSARIDFTELEVEDFAYDVARRFGAHGWATGWVDIRTQPALVAELHVRRARLDFEGGGADERLPLTVVNQGDVVVKWEHALRRATLLEPAHFTSPTGGFVVEGSGSPDKLAIHVVGDVQLRLLEPYTRRWLDRAHGSLMADVKIGGSLAVPLLDGTVAIKDAAVVPAGQDGAISVPRGSLKLSLNRIQADGILVEVDGQRLTIDGRLVLAALRPSQIDLTLRGRVAGKMLEMFAARQITHASGSAAVNLAVRGDAQNPSYSGDIVVDQPLELAPRALRRDVVLRAGRVRLNGQSLLVEAKDPLTGASDEGTFTVSGAAQLDPPAAAARVTVTGLVHQVPGLLSVEVDAKVNVVLKGGQLSVFGDLLGTDPAIQIVDGRFYAPLRINQFLQSAVFGERTSEEAEPFWYGSPLLANMDLDLRVATKKDSFAINNNIAHNVRLDGQIHITGTPPHPSFDGEVRSVGEGTITIPTLRIREFNVTDASVTFSQYKSFPVETPTAVLRADAPFVDLAGTEHQVLLEITGNLSAVNWSLKTSTGLNQIETLSLIWTGRTPDELRARARGDVTRAQMPETGTAAQYASPGASSTVAGFADEYLKEFTGDILGSLIEDPLRSVTSLDCFNLSVGADSVRWSGCKKFGAILQLNGEYEQGIGWYRLNGGFDGRLADAWTLDLQGWTYKPPQEAQGTQTVLRAQVKVHFTIP
jgi:hypothetical protein